MTIPKKLIIDTVTGETTTVEMTPEEIAQMEADAAEFAVKQAEFEAEEQRIADLKASAKQKLVSGSPLTEEEASVLVL